MKKLTASIIITTKNRKDELKRAVDSCLQQNGTPGILIFDDGSNDGTYDFIKGYCPRINVHREEKSIGLIDARTKAATMLEEDIIFSLDDDAIFSDENIVEDILEYFDHPSIGAVTIPYIDIYHSKQIKQIGCADKNKRFICGVYRGTAIAFRRDIFLKLGGYQKNFYRQGEESDYAIRMYINGYFIRVGNSKPIFHYESSTRDFKQIHYYAARNNLIICYLYTPAIIMLPYFVWLCVQLYLSGLKKGTVNNISKGILDFFRSIKKKLFIRTPLPFNKFVRYKSLLHRVRELK